MICIFMLYTETPVCPGGIEQQTCTLSVLAAWPKYTRSPLQDSRLFGPSPWKILATTYEQKISCATQPLAKIL